MKKFLLFQLFYLFVLGSIIAEDQLIGVTSPAYCSNIEGNTTINILAPTYTSVDVFCWKQGDEHGTNSYIGTVSLDAKGIGSIVFPADEFPHGPITLKIRGINSANYADNCYLQLYNKGGVSWKEGRPDDVPPPAAGMKLVFEDDFESPNLSIGPGTNTRYYDHKPDHTDFSSPLLFTSYSNTEKNPFSQVDTYLRIRGDQNKLSTGLLSSIKNDGSGFSAELPSYFECRFIAPNAPGTWPAFWLLSVKDRPDNKACDEYDIIEAYGGEGPKRPNSGAAYQIAAHPWGRTSNLSDPEVIEGKRVYKDNPIKMKDFGIPSAWYESPHIYGCKVDEDSVTYYLDNVEVQKHMNFYYAKRQPMYFLINLATGGGWPTDLTRYNGLIDMYVDYVRVYSGSDSEPDPNSPVISVNPGSLEFGEVNVNESKTLAFTINNTSTELPLDVTGISVDKMQFTIDWNAGIIAAGGSQTVNITFTPETSGIISATVTINSNASQSVKTIPVSGTGKSPFVAGTIHYVKQGGAGIRDGSSWDNAADNLQTTIDSAESGDTIFVAKGTYAPASGTSFSIGVKTLSIFGSFVGDETSRIPLAIPDTLNNKTILQGNGNRVVDASNALAHLSISGFRIQGGSSSSSGAGINVKNGLVSYCTVVDNYTTNFGGGVYSQGGTVLLTNCLILANQSAGGGLYAEGNNVLVDKCIIKGNVSTGQGGGAILNNTKMTNCLVVNNQAATNGGGIRTNGSNTVFVYNVTIADNTTAGSSLGGGISSQNISHKIINSIIWRNRANNTTNDVHGGDANSRTYCIYSGASGTGNINSDPLFVNPENGDYHLKAGSPAIKAGNISVVDYTADLDGNVRILNSTVDIGAYVYDQSTGTDIVSLVSTVNDITVYPNPANEKIYFSKNVAEAVLFSLTGQCLKWETNTNSLDLKSIWKGFYVLQIKNQEGLQQVFKIERN